MPARAAISKSRAVSPGFTLLEMCIVLFLIALLAAMAMPALSSAFDERALRDDSHGFSLLVKTAVIRCSEEQRPFVLTVDGKNVTLAPADGTGNADDTVTQALANPLKFPDAEKEHVWDTQPTASWTFQPNGLCPLPRLRFERGASYIELAFNALTGDVEDEADYLP